MMRSHKKPKWTALLCILILLYNLCSGLEAAATDPTFERYEQHANAKAILAEPVTFKDEPLVMRTEGKEDAASAGWIIKWKGRPDPALHSVSHILSEYPSSGITVAKPANGYSAEEWAERLSKSKYVQYMQPNQRVQAASSEPNDPLLNKQKYLQMIQAEKAWNQVKENKKITIALVDTGVDLNHPDLKANLVEGTNLIRKNSPPDDDNGHGTNVAGVVAAVSNNEKGIAGIVWKTKIMPIKALEANGRGDEDKLGQGIRYAVDNGANIVVLSVGLYRYSPYMREVVQYAENHDVLLISASGNDGKEVKYPAAYPTVLAVGGVTPDKQVEPHSNYGPEIDVVAPWDVYTTAKGGGYAFNEGTSMAAPQAAGVAALIWTKYPDMKPYEIRNLIRETAEDIGPYGWDPYSGYGLLRADRALTEAYRADFYEYNNSKDMAKPLPIDSMVTAELTKGTDQDWFSITAPYQGKVSLKLQAVGAYQPDVQLVYYPGNSEKGMVYKNILTHTVELNAPKGKSFIKLGLANNKSLNTIRYNATAEFEIYQDAFEDNDRQYMAYTLPLRKQSVTGTFDHVNDQDWYVLSVDKFGSLRLKCSTDTERIDPAIMLQRKEGKATIYDLGGEGETEYTPSIDVVPGQYYIKISNVISQNAYPAAGEYMLSIDFTEKYNDPNEPNDEAFQSTSMSESATYSGVFNTSSDQDWYSIFVKANSLLKLSLTNIPNRMISLNLYDYSLKQIYVDANKTGEKQLYIEKMVNPGKYYVKLTVDQPFQYQMYHLKYMIQNLVAGYKDIGGHWAQTAIVEMTNRKIVKGYGNYSFYPDHSLTRAEAAVMLAKTFKLTKQSKIAFKDVSSSHWAYSYIAKAVHANIVKGYKGGLFKPDEPVTRVEMAAMLANALGIEGNHKDSAPFSDIDRSHWAAPILRVLKGKHLVSGYRNGTFEPNRQASRAEAVTLLYRSIKQQ